MITPFGRKVSEGEEERMKEKKMLFILDTYFSVSAGKPLRPTIC